MDTPNNRQNTAPTAPVQVSQEMLNAAMKKAVETGLLPKYADTDAYLKQWDSMKLCLQAALDSVSGN